MLLDSEPSEQIKEVWGGGPQSVCDSAQSKAVAGSPFA